MIKMVEPIEIRIRTLTPLWTGDVNRQCTKLKETGIIGSLRWWYEALVRGLEGYACDPTSDEKCSYKKGSICDACYLFGCTDRKRVFSLRITNNDNIQKRDLIFLSRIEHPVFYYRKMKRNLNFWFKELYKSLKAFYGSIKFDLLSNSSNFSSEEVSNIIKFLLKLISIGGGLAAKSQLGFGIIKLLDYSIDEIKRGHQKIEEKIEDLEKTKRKIDVNFPSISDYKGFEIIFNDIDFSDKKKFSWWPKPPPKNAEYYQISFAVKFLLRNCIKNDVSLAQKICDNYSEIRKKCEEIKEKVQKNIKKKYTPSKVIARSIFGSDLSEKWASLIFISDAWKENRNYKMRIWSFIPKTISYDKVRVDENKIINLECRIEKDQLMREAQNIISSTFQRVTFSEIIDGKELIKRVLENEGCI